MFPPLSLLHRLRWVWFLAALTIMAGVASAADPTVRAHLNRRISVIADPVQLEIKIVGAHEVADPPEITVDGLEIRLFRKGGGPVLNMGGGTFNFERIVIYDYQVLPQRNGVFTIPPVTIAVDGKDYKTEALTLTVHPSSAPEGGDSEKIGFAEFVVPKKTVYLGEAIPIEMRLYVDARVRWQAAEMPEIAGEGFTKQKMPEPHKEEVERNGRDYALMEFKTVITPIRAGKLTIGPGTMSIQARVPRAQPSGGDILGSIFGDDVYSATQELKVKTEAVELTVKPLPQAGKPADFSGVVGTFQFSAEGSPKQIRVGDPLTMKMKISGRGNFDGVTAPVLIDPAGWRTYPASTKFDPDDPVNFTGAKTFEMAVIPETKKTTMPVFQFSYFDPGTEKYVTSTSEASPLKVEGEAPPAPSVNTSEQESPKPNAEPPAVDIVGLRYERDEPQTFAPLYEHREFWMVQGAVGLLLIGILAVKLRRRPDAVVRQRAALREEKSTIWRRLHRGDLDHADFFDAAARLAQIETALATGRVAASIDAPAVLASAQLDAGAAETIEDVFNFRAELLYAGGGGDGKVSTANRERVIEALSQLEERHANN